MAESKTKKLTCQNPECGKTVEVPLNEAGGTEIPEGWSVGEKKDPLRGRPDWYLEIYCSMECSYKHQLGIDLGPYKPGPTGRN